MDALSLSIFYVSFIRVRPATPLYIAVWKNQTTKYSEV